MGGAARQRLTMVWLFGVLAALVGCRAAHHTGAPDAGVPDRIMRGAVFYGAYCAGCHGSDGTGPGPLAEFLDIRPTDLRTPGLLTGVSDEQLFARLRSGAPLSTAPPRTPTFGAGEADEIERYLETMDGSDWPALRVGRLVFEAECASCHGVYGDGDGVYPAALQTVPPDLIDARERYTDEQLATVSVEGKGGMPRLVGGGFEPMEMRAIVAYVRHLSPGYRLYDRYCAACHGDDGRGVHPEDALAPVLVAPPIRAPRDEDDRRERVLHMLAREQGVMPHFRGLVDDDELRDVVAYLRTWETDGGADGS